MSEEKTDLERVLEPSYKCRNDYERILRFLGLSNKALDEYYDRIVVSLPDSLLEKIAKTLVT